MYPHADSELRGALCEQLVALLDIYLSGYVAQLTSLQQQRPPGAQQERYNTLEMEYSQRRSELLAPLRKWTITRYCFMFYFVLLFSLFYYLALICFISYHFF